jgi:hypothetical protein
MTRTVGSRDTRRNAFLPRRRCMSAGQTPRRILCAQTHGRRRRRVGGGGGGRRIATSASLREVFRCLSSMKCRSYFLLPNKKQSCALYRILNYRTRQVIIISQARDEMPSQWGPFRIMARDED